MSVIRVEILPTGADKTVRPVEKYIPRPPSEYIPEYQKLRTDLKPLNVVQPEGASFTVKEALGGSIIEWQKWYMRVGFNQREGMVIYDVSFVFISSRGVDIDPYFRFDMMVDPFSTDCHSPT
jgi:primary-amine oxidase